MNIDKEIEDELDSFDFDEDGFHTREGMRETLIKQKKCHHIFHNVVLQQGDIVTGVRCELCGFQIFT